jgi:polysaccharide biosynthesis protein PelD
MSFLKRVINKLQRERARADALQVNAVLETAMGILLLLALPAWFRGAGWGLLNIEPHPLWIVVVAIAVRYGGANGYFGGAASAVAYGLILWTRPGAHYAPLHSNLLTAPFCMLAAGGLIGEIVRAREGRLFELERMLHREAAARSALHRQNAALDRANAGLERRLALQGDSLVLLPRLGQTLQSLNLSELQRAILQSVSSLVAAESCALYIYQGEYLWLEAGIPPELPGRRTRIQLDDPVIGRAVLGRRTIGLGEVHDRLGRGAGEPGGAVMAGPLILADGQIYGVVAIESAPFAAVTPVSMARFDEILRWSSLALENALRFEESAAAAHERHGYSETEASWMLTPGMPRGQR